MNVMMIDSQNIIYTMVQRIGTKNCVPVPQAAQKDKKQKEKDK